jgi:hypothetical protein
MRPSAIRGIVIGFVVLALIGAAAGSSKSGKKSPSLTPPNAIQAVSTAASKGWGPEEIRVAREAFEQNAPNATKAQDECALAYETSRFSPQQVLHQTAAEGKQLGVEEAHACGK